MNSAEFLDSSWKTGLRLGLFSAKTGTPNSATCAPEAIPAGHMAELKCLQPDTGQDFDAFTHMVVRREIKNAPASKTANREKSMFCG